MEATNETKNNESTFYLRTMQPDWIIPFTINILLMMITLAVLVSLIHYGIKTRKWRSTHSCNLDKLNAGIVYTFVLICGCMCMLRYVTNQVYMNVGFKHDEDDLCEAAADAAFVAYSLILWSVSMFLWFRQRAFYTNRMLSFKSTKPVRIVSFASIILIVAVGFAYILLFTIPANYQSSSLGCLYKTSETFRDVYVIYAVLLIIVVHGLLLWLFIYPLLHIYSDNSAHSCLKKFIKPRRESLPAPAINNSSVERCSSLALKHPTEGIKKILQKTLIFAVLSIFVDVIIQILSSFATSPSSSRRITNMLFDITAFINFLFLIFSFVTFKSMLFSLCSKDDDEEYITECHLSTNNKLAPKLTP